MLPLDHEPVARFERLADLEGDAGDDVPQQILQGEAEHDGGDARAREQAGNGEPVADLQHHEERGDEDQQRDELTEKLRRLRVRLALKPRLPEIAPHQRDHEERGG